MDIKKAAKEAVQKVEEVGEKVLEEVETVAEKAVEKGKDLVEKAEEAVGIKEKKTEEKMPEEETKEAKKESTEMSMEEKKKAILEKAKKLGAKVDTQIDTEALKEQVKAKKRTDMLVPLEEYVKAGIYLGTKAVTPNMKPYVYRRRADGLAIFNTDIIDEKLKEAITYLSKFNPEDILLVCKRQAGHKAAKMFSRLTGIKTFTKKYPAGVLTNTDLPDFFENELTIVVDSWLDKNALEDTIKVKKEVLMICDTNNFSKGATQVVIGNNKSPRSLGLIFYLLAKGYCEKKKIECDIPELDWWTAEEDKGASQGV